METELLEREARAAFLSSLAKSQAALARMLESIADIGASSPESARLLHHNVQSLSALQATIAESVTGLQWRRRVRKKGNPGEPWLAPRINHVIMHRKSN